MNPSMAFPLPSTIGNLALREPMGKDAGKSSSKGFAPSVSGVNLKTGEAIPTEEASRLRQTAQDFEAVFLRQMLSNLERTTKVSSKPGGIAGQQTYGSMIVDVVAEAVAKAGGLGLADVLASSLRETSASSLQGVTAPSPSGSGLPTQSPVPESRSVARDSKLSAFGRNLPQGTSEGAVPCAEIRTSTIPSQGQLADRRIR